MPSAGEVEQFVYCPHNWYLARAFDPHDEGSRRGMAEHAAKGKAQVAAEETRRLQRDGLQWSFRLLAVAASATFLTLEVVYLRATPLHWVFLATALMVTAASAGLLVIGLDAEVKYRRQVRLAGLTPGRVVASDLTGESPLLEHGDLRGRPDTLLDTESGTVPVEVKTGRTPDRPFESHRMQLAVYLRLLEAQGTPAPYGLLNYPQGVFRINWDKELQEGLAEVLARMAAGETDRDHEEKGRCRGCARREACTQRLA